MEPLYTVDENSAAAMKKIMMFPKKSEKLKYNIIYQYYFWVYSKKLKSESQKYIWFLCSKKHYSHSKTMDG